MLKIFNNYFIGIVTHELKYTTKIKTLKSYIFYLYIIFLTNFLLT